MSYRKYRLGSYRDMCDQHRWEVPGALQHRRRRVRQAPPRPPGDDLGGLAWQRARGEASASSRTSRPSSRTCSRHTGSSAATAWPRCSRRCPRRPRCSSAPTRRGGDPALDVRALRRRGHRAPAARLRRQGARHRLRRTATGSPTGWHEVIFVLDDGRRGRARGGRRGPRRRARQGVRQLRDRGHRRPTIPPSSTTPPAPPGGQGHPPRAPLPARARGVRVLPRRAATASCSTARASGPGRRGSARCSVRGATARCSSSTRARAASTPRNSCEQLSKHGVQNMFTTPTALRSMTRVSRTRASATRSSAARSPARRASRSTPR